MKVLLGIGGSEDSFRALEEAVSRAREADDDLTIAVVENPESTPTVQEVRRRVEATLDDVGYRAEVRTLAGHPGSQLLAVAENEGFERIVLGGGETSPLGKVQLGGIAEFVLLNGRTTVTLIR